MDGSQPEVKKGRKFDQVLAGAREVFLAQGFEGASVDLIAKRAGVSKATLYSYFPDKRSLFMEVARNECAIQADRALCFEDNNLPIDEMLTAVAMKMMDFMMSDFAQRIFRICVAESDRFPELAREFYESGPRVMNRSLEQFFRDACEKGQLEIDDMRLAASQFQELIKADLFVRKVFNSLDAPPSQQDIRRIVRGAVTLFLAGYGAKDQPSRLPV